MASERGAFTFEQVLPRLLTAYEQGRLVPFIGVGMSRPHCADWPQLIARLEGAAGVEGELAPDQDTKTEELIRRANRAVHRLRSGAEGEFERALRAALFLQTDSVPPQTADLARIWWPLVITTNYDNFYVRAFGQAFDDGEHARGLAVVGRGSEDCQRVLNSLTTAGRALFWALQGHLAAPWKIEDHVDDRRLASELVIDHTEYRRVTYREPHFRRAFAEVFRHRSLFFLGSGLRENYLQELFGEVIELYGPSARTHYAFMKKGEVDPRFLYSRFQVAVVEYDEHAFVREKLGLLRAAIERADAVPVAWSWGRVRRPSEAAIEARSDLEVVRGRLPERRCEGECLAVSAGGALQGAEFWFSEPIRAALETWCGELTEPRKLSPHVGEIEGGDAFAVRARCPDKDTKDLLAVRAASRALFAFAAPRYRCIHMQLLATGGDDYERGGPRKAWSARPFPARFSFVETVRAWGEWRRENPGLECRLVLHVVDPSVHRELVSGRIDVLELLQSEDIRFWTEMVEDRALLERRQFHKRESTTLAEVVDELGIAAEHWDFEVSPPSEIETAGAVSLAGDEGRARLQRSLHDLRVFPGSTLHFRRATKRSTVQA